MRHLEAIFNVKTFKIARHDDFFSMKANCIKVYHECGNRNLSGSGLVDRDRLN